MEVIYPRKVNFYETDAQGVVHHSNYPRYFEEARGFFLESIGFPYPDVREKLNTDIVLLELHVKYRHPLYYGDRFEILTQLKMENRYFFRFFYTIRKGNDTVSTGETRHCCIDRDTRRMIPVPEEIKLRLK
ncbi:MAG TPA: acyl-CoA thioesterase [Persephonella sp.]|uniref:4-hydroxybenzoyl-CoA thioesterase n=1 Tax=Persephonella marina (strain DSM 14350 / EX-H1) TaxID=123214 RepID=C0QPZ6_PERMH|nr:MULTISPECIES: thioesterase family protein [Persephonella]ACO04812.1 4-hydroxybenzoyl-CoA thioesterase [Persephonella marina EX-H1]HCB69643.1 acyl-CoA thioesterase [Persephonella sp.]